MQKNWEIKHRNDGLYGRICQGKQFDTSRKKSWPMKMRDQNIDELQIHWYVTFDEKITDIPAQVEATLIQEYYRKHKRLPDWNEEFQHSMHITRESSGSPINPSPADAGRWAA